MLTVHGERPNLEKAYAFYIGKPSFAALPQDDKEEFESRLTFADGDTLAEADYREAVAHCLDPIDVNASTANLVKKNTCALSIVKEERARRTATKMLKCLRENDLSDLSDKELETIENIADAIEDGEDLTDSLTPEEQKVWNIILD